MLDADDPSVAEYMAQLSPEARENVRMQVRRVSEDIDDEWRLLNLMGLLIEADQ